MEAIKDRSEHCGQLVVVLSREEHGVPGLPPAEWSDRGKFTVVLRKNRSGTWLIESDMDNNNAHR